jgi:transcriptional regulator with XRE-family HTH domain
MDKKHLYINEWLDYKGKNPAWLAKEINMNRSQLSKILNAKRKRNPRPDTIDRITRALDLQVQDLWRNPFDYLTSPTPGKKSTDLKEWFDDPFATIDGKPATPELKKMVRSIFEIATGR